MARKKGGLGKGLDALFADAAPVIPEIEEITQEVNTVIDDKTPIDDADRVIYVDINDIKPNQDQPRKNFNQEKLNELANSITENGVIQPIIVRKNEVGYELVAGERRWRASRIAGLKKVPCIIRDFDEKQNLIVAIIENMQREDLDPIEEALGIKQMISKFDFTQEQVSSSLGKSRAYIANATRLLKLPEEIRNSISEGKMSAAHGRTLVSIADKDKQKKLAERIVNEGLSVRVTEKLAEEAKNKTDSKTKKNNKKTKSSDVIAVEEELRNILGTKVSIESAKKGGKLEIEYYSNEELNRIIDLLRTVAK